MSRRRDIRPGVRPRRERLRRWLPFAVLTGAVLLFAALFPDIAPVWTAAATVVMSLLILRAAEPAPAARGVWKRWVVPFAPFVLLAFVTAGLSALAAELNLAVMAIVVAVTAALALARWRLRGPHWVVAGTVAAGAVLVPVLSLLGVDAIWAAVGAEALQPLASLLVGAVLVVLATWLYLRPWWVRDASRHPVGATVAVLVVLVVAQPAAALLMGSGDGRPLSQLVPAAVSELDVISVAPASHSLGRPASAHGWQLKTHAGAVDAGTVRWGSAGAPSRRPRARADRVLLLLPDGAPQRLDGAGELPDLPGDPGEVRRWMRIADRVTARRETPTIALLQTTRPDRLDAWAAALTPADGDPDGRRHGRALSIQRLAGQRTLIDVVMREAVLAPTAEEDLALAARHMPALFFDSDEPYPVPLNVDRLLASGRMRLCGRGQAVRSACAQVRSAADLHNDADHLAFDPDEIAAEHRDSTIYVHVTRPSDATPRGIYLDFWWYFPHNPTGAGRGALCGAGFVLAGVTCFDHQSDWEGVTVVLDPGTDPPSPAWVSYAQHDGGTRYSWRALQELWRTRRSRGHLARFGRGIDTDRRPLVFVARGTHASYPTLCRSDACPIAGVPLREKRHDGRRPWPGNDPRRCASVCLAALPTRRGGDGRALWNAFEGRWGTANCVAGILCSSSPPPRSPGAQPRYKRPWCVHRTVEWDGRRHRHRTTPKAERC